jgi:hypothetical protein
MENSAEYHYFSAVSEMEVSLVGDAFVKFRETCFKDYGLDAAYNYMLHGVVVGCDVESDSSKCAIDDTL